MAVLYTDNFNRTNETPITTPWLAYSSSFNLTSNQLRPVTASFNNGVVYDSWSNGNDQYSQFVIAQTGGLDGGPMVRMDWSVNRNGYFASAEGGTQIQLWKIVADGFTSIGTFSGTYATNDVIRVEAQSTTIRVKKNTVQIISVTDTDLTTGKPGAFAFVNDLFFDTFEAGDFSAGGTVKGNPISSRGGTAAQPVVNN